ncbi:MAG: sulfatase [Actinomycetota bacterium]|nr:sulfatase [Actinomycetota bacterium]
MINARTALFLLALLPAALLLRLESAAAAARPNVVVIQTDDQSANTLRARFRGLNNRIHRAMPNTLDRIARQGTEFTRYYATHPVCSPSRASLLTGQYAHSSGLKKNSGPTGGWEGWQQLPLFNRNMAVDLQRNGYRTIHVGKFTNNYTLGDGQVETVIPPGWDRWVTASYGGHLYFYGFGMNINGVPAGPFGSMGYDLFNGEKDPPECSAALLTQPTPAIRCDYNTDVYSRHAVAEIEAAGDQPFYLQLDYHAPHGDHRSPAGPEPATRHFDSAFKNRMPKMPGFNEGNINDKPSWLKKIAEPMKKAESDRVHDRWVKEVESLRAVDDGVGAIMKTLRKTGKLKNTYVIFLSDNGLFHGEHRLSSAKFLPYEPSARVPMMIRGPGIGKGKRSGEIVANIDIAPTILGLTGTRSSDRLDGRSLKPFWKRPGRRTLRPLVLESYVGPGDLEGEEKPDPALPGAGISVPAPPQNFTGLRVGDYKYIEYQTGDRELYDLKADPWELNNRARNPRFRPIVRRLSAVLKARKDCRGSDCRKVINRLPARK